MTNFFEKVDLFDLKKAKKNRKKKNQKIKNLIFKKNIQKRLLIN